MKTKTLLVSLLMYSSVYAGGLMGTAGSNAQVEPLYLVDMPTAGILHNGMVGMSVHFYENSGVLVSLEAGAFNRLSFGLSYGGTNIIGNGAVNWNKLPGIDIRVRALDETTGLPALTFGFDSQGKSEYLSEYSRYLYKSPGFFVAASKYFSILGYLGVHGGINYSLENGDGNKNINFYVGADKTIGSDISLVAEFNFGVNDNYPNGYPGRLASPGPGFINTGVRWSLGNGFTLEFDYKNLLDLKKSGSLRTIRIDYVQSM